MSRKKGDKDYTKSEGCPLYIKSFITLSSNLNTIGKVPFKTSILILQGENDTQTTLQQSFLLQQKLTSMNHPDHVLITYPNLEQAFYPSSQWQTGAGPIQQNVLADIYLWLESHSGFTPLYTSILSSNSSSSNNFINK